jgi:hypothetical protein
MFDGAMDLSMFRNWTPNYFELIKSMEVTLPELKHPSPAEQIHTVGKILNNSRKASLRIRTTSARVLFPLNISMFQILLGRTYNGKVEIFLPAALKPETEIQMSSFKNKWGGVVLHFEDSQASGVTESDDTDSDDAET